MKPREKKVIRTAWILWGLAVLALVAMIFLTGCTVGVTDKSGTRWSFSLNPTTEQLDYFAK